MRLITCTRDPVRVWQTNPCWQAPGRREHIYGRVQSDLPDTPAIARFISKVLNPRSRGHA